MATTFLMTVHFGIPYSIPAEIGTNVPVSSPPALSMSAVYITEVQILLGGIVLLKGPDNNGRQRSLSYTTSWGAFKTEAAAALSAKYPNNAVTIT